jgi:hypothetical protein
METSRTLPGDVNAKPALKPVAPELQRRAMQLIAKDCLSLVALSLPEDVLYNLSLGYDATNGSRNASWNAALRNEIHFERLGLLFTLMDPSVCLNILENEFKIKEPKKVYSLTEHFKLITDSVFEELHRGVDIAPLRRDLQRSCLRALLNYSCTPVTWFVPAYADARLVSKQELQRLRESIKAKLAKSSGLSKMTVMHLQDMMDAINKTEKRKVAEVVFD